MSATGALPIWLTILQKAGRLSDIEFLAIKEFGNKLRSAEGNVTAAGDIAFLTANSGKDMYLASAKVTFSSNIANTGLANESIVELKINGTIIETVRHSTVMSANTGINVFEYEFKNIGQKVAATQIIKIEATVLDSDIQCEGFIECFEENTGTTPQV